MFCFLSYLVNYYSPRICIQIFKYFTSNSFIIWIQTDFYHIIKGILAPVTVFPSFIKMSKGIIWFSSIPCYMFKKKKKELLISITTKFKSFIIYLANKTITLKCRKCNSMRKKTPLYRVYLLINLPKI